MEKEAIKLKLIEIYYKYIEEMRNSDTVFDFVERMMTLFDGE